MEVKEGSVGSPKASEPANRLTLSRKNQRKNCQRELDGTTVRWHRAGAEIRTAEHVRIARFAKGAVCMGMTDRIALRLESRCSTRLVTGVLTGQMSVLSKG